MSKLTRLLALLIPLAAGCAQFQPQPVTIRVLSYNIHHGEGLDKRLDLERIARVIRESRADLVALQEVDRRAQRTSGVDQPARLAELTGLHVVFEKNIDLQGGEYGNAILSRFPIEAHENHRLPTLSKNEQRGVLEARVNVNGRPLIFLATHLQVGNDDGERVASAEHIQRLLTSHPGRPVILAGDLNATPDERPLTLLRNFLADSCTAGGPLTFTIPANAPKERIDYILYTADQSLSATASRVLPEIVASDHRPVLATFTLNPRTTRSTAPTTQPATGLTIDQVTPAVGPGFPDGLKRIDYTCTDGFKDWALVLPSEDPVWIVMIHGHGSTGDQLFTRPDIRDAWLPLFRKHHGIISVNLRGNAWMSPAAAADLHALLSRIQAVHGRRRFIFASGSMGGTSNLVYAALRPEDVAGVVALCPATDLPGYHAWTLQHAAAPVLTDIRQAIESAYAGPPEKQAVIYRAHSALANHARLTMPVYVVHGAADSIIPVEQSRALAEAMSKNPNFRYAEIPGEHDAPLAQMPEALSWVLEKIGGPKN